MHNHCKLVAIAYWFYLPENVIYLKSAQVTLSAGSGTGSFSSTLRTFVRVVHCPLVASIVGGGVSYKEVGYNKTVSFTPLLHSYDPDLVLPEDRSQVSVKHYWSILIFSVIWACELKKNPQNVFL